MWRSVLVLLLMPSLTAAQAAPEVHPGFSPRTVDPILWPPRSASAPGSLYQAYTRHTAIRRGTDEDVGIVMAIGGFVTVHKSAVPGVVPLQLEFEPLEGLQVRAVHDPEVYKSKFKFQGQTVKVAWSPNLKFKVRADHHAPLGPRELRAKVTFQKVPGDGSALGPVEHVDVLVPITVVDHDTKVQKAEFPFAQTPTWVVVALIVAAPVLIVLFIPLLFVCVAMQCPD